MALVKYNKNRIADSGYKFTVTRLNDPQIKQLKGIVSEYNTFVNDRNKFRNKRDHERKWRVRFMGRNPNRKQYESYSGEYRSYLPQKYSTHWDVYVHEMR